MTDKKGKGQMGAGAKGGGEQTREEHGFRNSGGREQHNPRGSNKKGDPNRSREPRRERGSSER